MPRFDKIDDTMEQYVIAGSTYQFSGIRPTAGNLQATEYTLVTISCDITGSVYDFKDELLKAVKESVKACKKSPKPENLLVRYVLFNHKDGIQEQHGFKPLSAIDIDNDYTPFKPDGRTNLFDATYDAVGATLKYAKTLIDLDYTVNGILFVITDGDDNASNCTPSMIANQVAKQKENIESLITVLVGVNTGGSGIKKLLSDFKSEANLDTYIDIAEASDKNLAKLTGFISKSVSSQSQSINTGKSAPIPTW